MADLDTRLKRASSVALMQRIVLAPPLPDGTIDGSDRYHLGRTYGGIASAALVINSQSSNPVTYLDVDSLGVSIKNTVTLSVTVKDKATGSPIEGALVLLKAASGGPLTVNTQVIIPTYTNASGVVENTAFNYTTAQPVIGVVRMATSYPHYKTGRIQGSITGSGFSQTVQLVYDF